MDSMGRGPMPDLVLKALRIARGSLDLAHEHARAQLSLWLVLVEGPYRRGSSGPGGYEGDDASETDLYGLHVWEGRLQQWIQADGHTSMCGSTTGRPVAGAEPPGRAQHGGGASARCAMSFAVARSHCLHGAGGRQPGLH